MSSTAKTLDRRKQQALDALLSHTSVKAAARAPSPLYTVINKVF